MKFRNSLYCSYYSTTPSYSYNQANNHNSLKNKKQALHTLSLLKTNSSLTMHQSQSQSQSQSTEKKVNKTKIQPLLCSEAQSSVSNFLNPKVGEYKDYSHLMSNLNINDPLENINCEYEYDLSSFINNNQQILATSIDNLQTSIQVSERDTSEMNETDHINIVYQSIDAKFKQRVKSININQTKQLLPL